MLCRLPVPLIAKVRLDGNILEISAPFAEVAGLPPGAFLTNLDTCSGTTEILTLDER